jgi:hypothetical protein
MARVALSLVILVAAVTGIVLVTKRGPEPIELLAINQLPKGTKHLEIGEVPTYAAALKRRLTFQSNVDKDVTLKVTLEDAQPAAMTAALADNATLLPRATRTIGLTVLLTRKPGDISGRLVFSSDDVPGWSHAVTFNAKVVQKEMEGKRIGVQPTFINLGDCKPGEKRPFVATVANLGSEPLTVREWRHDERRMELRELAGGEILPPGAKLRVSGTVTVPESQGAWSTDLDILSDADLVKLKRLRVAGVVKPEHTLDRPRVRLGNVFPPRQDRFEVTVTAAEGVAPFKVVRVTNLATLFEVVSLGSDAPAAEQTVELRVKKTAPTGPLAAYPLRLVVEPPGREITVHVDAWLRASVYARPGRVSFGKVKPGTVIRPREVLLHSFAGKTVRANEASTRHGYFVAELKQGAGAVPSVLVWPTPGLKPATYRDVILIEVDSEDTPRIEVEAFIELEG